MEWTVRRVLGAKTPTLLRAIHLPTVPEGASAPRWRHGVSVVALEGVGPPVDLGEEEVEAIMEAMPAT